MTELPVGFSLCFCSLKRNRELINGDWAQNNTPVTCILFLTVCLICGQFILGPCKEVQGISLLDNMQYMSTLNQTWLFGSVYVHVYAHIMAISFLEVALFWWQKGRKEDSDSHVKEEQSLQSSSFLRSLGEASLMQEGSERRNDGESYHTKELHPGFLPWATKHRQMRQSLRSYCTVNDGCF